MTDRLESFEDRLDASYIGKCSYYKCERDEEESGTVWIENVPFRFHPECQREYTKEIEDEKAEQDRLKAEEIVENSREKEGGE